MIQADHSGFDPEQAGVYACRVPDEVTPFVNDIFLSWDEDKWCYPGSDIAYRGSVHGWVGPLPREPAVIES